MKANLQKLIPQLNPEHTKVDEPLKKHTTVKIGGPADIFYQPRSTDELINAVKAARELDVPVTMLGWGANVLVSDKGIRGLVIRNHSKNITIDDEVTSETHEKDSKVIEEWAESYDIDQARWDSATEAEGGRQMYEFKDLDFDESDKPIVEVTMDSGVDLPFAVNHLVYQGITGLQWYGRIPGTIGGAIYNNIHGGTHFIHEIIKEIRVFDENSQLKTYTKQDLKAEYDYSLFHETNDIILDATFVMRKGNREKAIYVAQEWTKRKAVLQPSISIGCVFQNITNEERDKREYPTGSVGYIIEHVLNMKGFHIGDAWISPGHHNFIENRGNATAKDYYAVIQEIQKRAKEQLDIDLQLEIFLMGTF